MLKFSEKFQLERSSNYQLGRLELSSSIYITRKFLIISIRINQVKLHYLNVLVPKIEFIASNEISYSKKNIWERNLGVSWNWPSSPALKFEVMAKDSVQQSFSNSFSFKHYWVSNSLERNFMQSCAQNLALVGWKCVYIQWYYQLFDAFDGLTLNWWCGSLILKTFWFENYDNSYG